MAPKSKSKLPEWNLCLFCNRTISKRDISKHTEVCNDRARVDSNNIGHGFIKDSVLHAIVGKSDSKGIPQFSPKGVIYLNPGAMQLTGMCIGRPILCTYDNHKEVITAWPNSAVLPGYASFTNLSRDFPGVRLKPGDMLMAEYFLPNPIGISELSLTPLNPQSFMTTAEFRKYFATVKNQCYVSAGSNISMSYLGQPCDFIVTKIVTLDGKTFDSGLAIKFVTDNHFSDSVSGLSENLSRMNVADMPSSSSIDFDVSCTADSSNEMATSTPIKNESMAGATQFCTPVKFEGLDEKSQDTTFFYIDIDTRLDIFCDTAKGSENIKKRESKTTFTSIGGLSKQIETLKDMVMLPLKEVARYKALGVPHVRGILLFGPSGCGKTMVARALLAELGLYYKTVNAPDVYSKFQGETEANLREIFAEAEANTPSVIFVDDIEALCPRRDGRGTQSQQETRVVSTLLSLMDNLGSLENPVVVLAATNKPELLDPALRRPGRLDREMEIPVPTATDRADILCKLLYNMRTDLSTADVASIADVAHGYVGADLAAVCREAGMHALRRCRRIPVDAVDSDGHVAEASLLLADMLYGIKAVKPSAMREVMLEVPKVLWTDIGGQHELKHKLKQAIEWPLKHPAAFQRMGINPPRGVLMYGPPGCSKTMTAKALATESGLNFIAVKGPELFSKWVGESEQAVREVFRKARAAAPSIVFFDEIDALAVARGGSGGGHNVGERVLAQLLTEMDGVEALQNVIVVAATNRPDMIDKALLRPGRLDRVVYVSLPDVEAREEIFRIQFRRMPIAEDVRVEELAKNTHGYSGAEIVSVCQEAALASLEESLTAETITWKHFEKATLAVKPRTDSTLIEFYDKYMSAVESKFKT
ncbi:PREDICTED: spermatogenesis-associated protein 5-like [Priapulus caudatus]|uniref:Spermatogenesis-associated protein 5-like n=1 Tax=Priapulus caudatus TaxID=37621 RepID=A0ABM1DNS5_PRICU|nr:PREDICTED: spermatogenesis-associated protein 5-like [Priapulus caudatus]XP_014661598.1 PREDICTED: spermatogenesis-associated protein 5-like [Priapulus caudatus]